MLYNQDVKVVTSSPIRQVPIKYCIRQCRKQTSERLDKNSIRPLMKSKNERSKDRLMSSMWTRNITCKKIIALMILCQFT